MSYTLLSRNTRTAQKQHRCIWCGEDILPGESYVDERSVFDGDFQKHRWHPECEDDFQAGHDDTFTPYSAERPKREVAPC